MLTGQEEFRTTGTTGQAFFIIIIFFLLLILTIDVFEK